MHAGHAGYNPFQQAWLGGAAAVGPSRAQLLQDVLNASLVDKEIATPSVLDIPFYVTDTRFTILVLVNNTNDPVLPGGVPRKAVGDLWTAEEISCLKSALRVTIEDRARLEYDSVRTVTRE